MEKEDMPTTTQKIKRSRFISNLDKRDFSSYLFSITHFIKIHSQNRWRRSTASVLDIITVIFTSINLAQRLEHSQHEGRNPITAYWFGRFTIQRTETLIAVRTLKTKRQEKGPIFSSFLTKNKTWSHSGTFHFPKCLFLWALAVVSCRFLHAPASAHAHASVHAHRATTATIITAALVT